MLLSPTPTNPAKRRHWDDAENAENWDRQLASGSGKMARQQYSPAVARCHFAGGLHATPQTVLTALLSLFPGMDERVVTNVLQECGNNIDAAIRRLGELRLSASDLPAGAAQDATASTVEDRSGDTGTSSGAAGPVTAEQWVEALVGEMSAATDLANAKQRAAAFLQRFEAFVSRYLKQQQAASAAGGVSDAALASPSASPAASDAALAARCSKLAEENAVLKKAVQIQHRQLQERSGQEAETAQLKALLAQYQEQVRTLQVSNYSLSLHLQKATSASVLDNSRNPDVF